MVKHFRVTFWTIAALVLGLTLAPIQAQDRLLYLLSFIDDDQHGDIAYGDIGAWHTSWNIPRIDNPAKWKNLELHQRNYVDKILPKQTVSEYLLSGYWTNQRQIVGIDVFNTERFLYDLSDGGIIELHADTSTLGNILTAVGFRMEQLDQGRLYTLPLEATLRFYLFHQILVLDDKHVLISWRRNLIDKALAAHQNPGTSLAENPAYVSAALALDNEIFNGTGELTGAIFVDGASFAQDGPKTAVPFADRGTVDQSVLDEIVATYPPLPAFEVAVFATRHTAGSSYQVMMLVFPEGVDAEAAANSLKSRLKTYDSLLYHGNLLETYNLQITRSRGIEINGLPVAVVMLQADDPPQEFPEGSIALPNTVPTTIPYWFDMVTKFDYGFLAVTE